MFHVPSTAHSKYARVLIGRRYAVFTASALIASPVAGNTSAPFAAAELMTTQRTPALAAGSFTESPAVTTVVIRLMPEMSAVALACPPVAKAVMAFVAGVRPPTLPHRRASPRW
jgi:hypothetical protein